ncbi:fimbrial protein [Bordetella tumulicola]|uniref:fimbrial protein n=1 Tax=Bordetella tumulicola TaxID=1649133 RepID=UPI0039EFAAAA
MSILLETLFICARSGRRAARLPLAAISVCVGGLGACASVEPPLDIAAAARDPVPNGLLSTTAPPGSIADLEPKQTAVPVARLIQDAIERASREGIGALAPANSIPVAPAADIPLRELPLDPMPCEMSPAEGLIDASLQIDAPAAPLPVQCASLFPDIASVPEQSYSFGLETTELAAEHPVILVTRAHPSTHPWFSAVGSQQGFAYSGGRWTYRDAEGPMLSLGNLTANAPIWGGTVPIGGLQVSSGWRGGIQTLPEGALAYSSSVGLLNYTDTAASSGAIDYGVTAGSGSLRYGLTPALTVESQMQSAPNLATQGVGTTYAAGDLGAFAFGATQSTFDSVNAWRYRFGYSVNLAESVSLAVTNEHIDAGFGDLASYRNGAGIAPQMRNTLAAGVPLSGWGTLTGTYTDTQDAGVSVEQRFGLEHSMLVAPTVRLAVGADRDVVTGDYEVRAGISMPVDTFMYGRWLSW